MATDVATSIRERVQARGARIARVKRFDRAATGIITLGGAFIIVSVLFIFLFILGEALPLFRGAQGHFAGVLPLAKVAALESAAAPDATDPASAGATPAAPGPALAQGIDEYQLYLYQVLTDARVVLFRLRDGQVAHSFPFAGITGARVTTASRSSQADYVAAGSADGRVALAQMRFRPRYENQRLIDLDVELRERGLVTLAAPGQSLRELSYEEHEGSQALAGIVADDEIVVWRRGEDTNATQHSVRSRDGERFTHLRLARTSELVAVTARGNLYHWTLGDEPQLDEVVHVAEAPVSAIEYALGSTSLLVGDEAGNVSAWFRVRRRDEDTSLSFVRAHSYASQGSAVSAIGRSSRDKSFVTAGADGALVLRHLTSERSLLRFPADGQHVDSVLIAPKSDALFTRRGDGSVARYAIASPHPEISWRALFGKVWYEGYAKPEYVWQSTGATDDFEAKFSLVPLVFGTIKGTLYALLFAVPLAIMGALYTSQFMHPHLKARVKPVVEIMAALPSVVIGFVAGLWLASRVEAQVVPVLMMIALLPAFGTAGVLIWGRLPQRLTARLRPGMEITLIVPLLLCGALVALALGPAVEAMAFAGDFKLWLSRVLGLIYDQRNSLVVGVAMGFAIIPIIFTISEDSFSSVPAHLTAASLALGASRWQTAVRVVLPTASPGIFSAVMIGFGRAVGETMIVLMATGNTPVLDWSVFNGMRTLSANIAVEIPEAPYGGTLYRVLFLAGGVLFAMTFVVNTIAELIRQRLRERYKAI
jgi:phosphate transport system permease protein